MARHNHLRFDPAAAMVARRPFTFDGVSYSPGQDFSIPKGGATRQVRLLYRSRRIVRKDKAPAGRWDRQAPAVQHVAGGFRVVVRSPGWFDVLGPGDEVVTQKPVRESAAKKLADSLAKKAEEDTTGPSVGSLAQGQPAEGSAATAAQ